MNKIKITKVEVRGATVKYHYDLTGEWKKYFCQEEMEITYSIDIQNVPQSVLVVPFICNILPIVWLCDAEIHTEFIDKDFYNNVEKIKEGYRKMYPMLEFKGKIVADVRENIPLENKRTVACFFSGGVDAYTTLIRHLEDKPALLTIWGADVKLTDEEGWRNVTSHIQNVAEEFGLEYIYVKSNFRQMIKEGLLRELVKVSGEGWWHGFQHGIAIIAHAAPIAYAYGLKHVYIASSFPQKMAGRYTCASDPTIDNHVHYCKCDTVHDGYEMDRQEKVRYLIAQNKRYDKDIKLRVCWKSTGGRNCCHCEKCYRTILEIVSEGGDPNEYGFEWKDADIRNCKNDMLYRISSQQFCIMQYYPSIQEAMKENAEKIDNIAKYDWFLKIDFNTFNSGIIKRMRRSLIARAIRKIYCMMVNERIRK